ncbi:MAG: universal stress protein [Chloroflexota bacterium]|nr:universal stress protein [Chloroflexota bacterium]
MSDFRRVLVPIDGSDLSERAVPFAVSIAGDGGTVVLLQVLPEAEPLRKPLGAITMSADEVLTMLTDLANQDLDRAEARWADLTGNVTIIKETYAGDAASVILDRAEADGVDLVCMSSSGRGAIGRVALGSVADKVVRTATVPTLIVRHIDLPEGEDVAPLKRIIVPLDGSDRALLALPVAGALAKRFGTSIELISAVDLPQVVSPAMAYGGAFAADYYVEVEKESTKAADQHLDEAVAKLADFGATVNKHVMLGSAVAAISDFAEHGDLVVMTTRGQGGFRRWLLGSVAEKLIRDCPAPVLIVPSPHED